MSATRSWVVGDSGTTPDAPYRGRPSLRPTDSLRTTTSTLLRAVPWALLGRAGRWSLHHIDGGGSGPRSLLPGTFPGWTPCPRFPSCMLCDDSNSMELLYKTIRQSDIHDLCEYSVLDHGPRCLEEPRLITPKTLRSSNGHGQGDGLAPSSVRQAVSRV